MFENRPNLLLPLTQLRQRDTQRGIVLANLRKRRQFRLLEHFLEQRNRRIRLRLGQSRKQRVVIGNHDLRIDPTIRHFDDVPLLVIRSRLAVEAEEGDKRRRGVIRPVVRKHADIHAIGIDDRPSDGRPPLVPGDGDIRLRPGLIGLDGDQVLISAQDHPVKLQRQLVDVIAALGAELHMPRVLHAAKNPRDGAGRIRMLLRCPRFEIIPPVDHLIFLQHAKLDHRRNVLRPNLMRHLRHLHFIDVTRIEDRLMRVSRQI